MEPIKRGMSTSKKILSYIFLLLVLYPLNSIPFINGLGGIPIKIVAVSFDLLAIFIGVFMLRGKLPPSLIIDEEGIKRIDIKDSVVPWDNVLYISNNSLYCQKMAETLRTLTTEEIQAMDGQEYEEMQSCAQIADIQGVFVGIRDQDEIALNYFFKNNEYPVIVEELEKRRKYYFAK